MLKGGFDGDTLDGGNGNDRLLGNFGRDILIGGSGKDRLIGGGDADTFVLAVGNGTDVIADFDPFEGDRIGLSGGLGIGELTFSGRNIIVTETNEILATVRRTDTASIDSNRFVTLSS